MRFKHPKLSQLVVFGVLLTSAQFSFACDDALKNFPRDCQIQDRYREVREKLALKNVNITNIAEYKAIRFIDRKSWENAKVKKIKPHNIYNPAPYTWTEWETGIHRVFNYVEYAPLAERVNFTNGFLSSINTALITPDIQNPNTRKKLQPGIIRRATDINIGFCTKDGVLTQRENDIAQRSILEFQEKWEQRAGVKLTSLTQDPRATLTSNVGVQISYSGSCDWFTYVSSPEVAQNVAWFQKFIKYNIDLYRLKKPVLSPIELAAFAQKWFVTIHPFVDGNGRTSRAVQDLILSYFDLPFAPGGDLQNDTLSEINAYLQLNYDKIEESVSKLEACPDFHNLNMRAQVKSPLRYQCSLIQAL